MPRLIAFLLSLVVMALVAGCGKGGGEGGDGTAPMLAPDAVGPSSRAPECYLVSEAIRPSSTHGPNGPVTSISLSSDGTLAAFTGTASNLIAGESSSSPQAYVQDRTTGAIRRLSHTRSGGMTNSYVDHVRISGDGSRVVFIGNGDDLSPMGHGPYGDVYAARCDGLGDLQLVSVAADGGPADHDSSDATISDDGRLVVFTSLASNLVAGDTNGVMDVFVRDLITGTTVRVSVASDGSQGDGDSLQPTISGDGRLVAFSSDAGNFGTGGDGRRHIFVHDLATGTTTCVDVTPSGGLPDSYSGGPVSLSRNGRYLAFTSTATNLIAGLTLVGPQVYRRDLVAGVTALVSFATDGTPRSSSGFGSVISPDGMSVAFISGVPLDPADLNSYTDIYLRDLAVAKTTLISVANGIQANNQSILPPCFGNDGRVVAWSTGATNLGGGEVRPQVVLYDRVTGTTSGLVCPAAADGPNGSSWDPTSMSSDGRYVAFSSSAGNLVAEDHNHCWDVFVRDTQTHLTRRINLGANGTEADRDSWGAAMTPDGRYVVFQSRARNLVPGTTGDDWRIYRRDLATDTTILVSVAADGRSLTGSSDYPCVSADGNRILFRSWTDDLVPGYTHVPGLYLRDVRAGTTVCVDRNLDHDGISGGAYDLHFNGWGLSADGQRAVFNSTAAISSGAAPGMSGIIVRDFATGALIPVSVAPDGAPADGDSFQPRISADGRWVVFRSLAANLVAGDTNGRNDIFLRDLTTGTTTRVTAAADSGPVEYQCQWPSINADGRFIAYEASDAIRDQAGKGTAVYLYDRIAGTTRQVSVAGSNRCREAALSPDGRFVTFVADEGDQRPDLAWPYKPFESVWRLAVMPTGTD